MMSQLTLFLLGTPSIEIDHELVDLPRRKIMALLIYVALAERRPTRDALATMLWPESEPKSARAALRRELHTLNQTIGEQWLAITRDDIGLHPNANVVVDVHTFRQLLGAAAAQAESQQQLEEAIRLYRGDFLAGFTLSDCPSFDDWQFFEGAALRRDLAAALTQLVRIARARQHYESAIGFARRQLALDPLEEAVHRELMQLFALAGQQSAAVRQYDECARILDEELGVPPDEATVTLYEQIRTRQFTATMITDDRTPVVASTRDLDAIVQPVATATAGALCNLPHQSSSFVGRQVEIEEITTMLREEPTCRLLTLVGPGGIGKTRLAVQVAQRFVDTAASTTPKSYSAGICFVPLENAADGEQLVAAIADAVGFTVTDRGRLLDQLIDYLQAKELLLILDNVEQLQEHADLLSTLLQRAPLITIIATSREALALQEEWIYSVVGFALPQLSAVTADADETQHVAVTMNSAVQLFVQRARRVDSTLPLLDEAIPAPMLAQIVRICYLVDGLPLGLELAATWVRTLSLQEIADEIAADLDFLTTTRRTASARHSSMRAVLEQTWRLLTAAEQVAFCQLAYFHNGFTRQAALRVANVTMLVLAALVRKSIISHGRDGRYQMHGLLRQFAVTRLRADAAQFRIIAENHSRYFGYLVESWQGEFAQKTSADAQSTNVITKELLVQIGNDVENVRHGWRWALAESGTVEQRQLANRYIDALFHFYDIRSRFQDGWTEFTAAVNALPTTSSATEAQAERSLAHLQGRLLARLGWFAFQIGHLAEASAHLQQSLALLRQGAPQSEMIFALNYLGALYRHTGDYEHAETVLTESCHRCQSCGDQFGLTVALNILGQVAYEKQAYDLAQRRLEESLVIKGTIGDRRGTTYSLLYLGLIAQAQADPARAIRLFQESRLISEEYGDRRTVAIALENWADVEATLGNANKAADLYQQSLALYDAIYNRLGTVTTLIKLGDLACREADDASARQHYTVALESAKLLQPLPQRLAVAVGRVEQWVSERRFADSPQQVVTQTTRRGR